MSNIRGIGWGGVVEVVQQLPYFHLPSPVSDGLWSAVLKSMEVVC